MDKLTIGQRIAAKRKELGLSQIELGEKMNVSRQSVSKWESDAAIPEIDKLIALSKLYQVSVGWLLGVEPDGAPAREPEQTFRQQDWEIIDRLAQEKPRLPKWLLPLVAGAMALSLIATALSGAAYYHTRSRNQQLAAISQSIAHLTAGLGTGLSDKSLLGSYSFQAQPSPDLNECTFRFLATPIVYEPDAAAELHIVLGSEEVHRQECQWDGTWYTAEFTLPVRDGYTASFTLTGADSAVRLSPLHDPLLSHLLKNRAFGDISVTWEKLGCVDNSLTFENMRFEIDAPEIYRDTPDLWAQCDLVVLAGGKELGRTDILNRSAYSKAVNFSNPDVSFFTRSQSVAVGDLAGIDQVEIMLLCKLTDGTDLLVPIRTVSTGSWR